MRRVGGGVEEREEWEEWRRVGRGRGLGRGVGGRIV